MSSLGYFFIKDNTEQVMKAFKSSDKLNKNNILQPNKQLHYAIKIFSYISVQVHISDVNVLITVEMLQKYIRVVMW